MLRPVGEQDNDDERDQKILGMEVDSDAETDIDEPWTYLNSTETPSVPNSPVVTPEPVQPVHSHHPPKYLSARVAAWIIPKLPPAPPAPSKFKIAAARLAGQRLYVSTYPVYAPFIADLIQLAAWADWNRSARVCAAWWLFWFFNLLLPALLGKILFSLLRRRLTPYPNLAELRQRRRLTREADELGDAMEGPGAATSFLGTGPMPGVGAGGGDMGVRDMWKLVKLVTKGKGKKGKQKVKEAGDAVAEQAGLSMGADSDGENQADDDWRKAALKAMEEIADFHERVRKYATIFLTHWVTRVLMIRLKQSVLMAPRAIVPHIRLCIDFARLIHCPNPRSYTREAYICYYRNTVLVCRTSPHGHAFPRT